MARGECKGVLLGIKLRVIFHIIHFWHLWLLVAPQFIYVMKDLRKVVPPSREILKGIWLSFYPGAKIGVLGPNGAGKSSLLRIMAGVDQDFIGEAWAHEGTKIGYLSQEPPLDPS